MKILSKFSLKKILFFYIVIFFIIFALISVIEISNIRNIYLKEKKEQLKHQEQIVYKLIESYYKAYKNGELSEKEAKERAKEIIRNLRFDSHYFWINDTRKPVSYLILHPMMPNLEGKFPNNPIFLCVKAIQFGENGKILKFKKKVHILKVIPQIIKKTKEGFIFYEWPKLLGKNTWKLSPKLSYVKLFEPWGWVIGTGIYIDDVETYMWKNIFKFSLFIFIGFGTVFALFIIIMNDLTKAINNIVTTIKRAKTGNFSKRLDIERKDEIGEIAKALNEMIREYEKFARFEKIFYFSEIPLFLVDKNFKFVDCNYSAIKLLNYKSREEFLTSSLSLKNLSPAFQPDGRNSSEKAREMIRLAFEKGYNKFEWVCLKSTREELPIEISLTPIVYKGKELLYSVWRDLSREKELYQLSITDPLTTIYNRYYFVKRLEEEIRRTERKTNYFSLIMADIDRFKNVNDTFGHAVGDKVLVKMVELFKNRLRKTDIICRWGGEEFLILLPETPVSKAVKVAEYLRKSLENMYIPEIKTAVTASFGVTGYCPGDTVETIVERVDAMMYKAKAEGRNRVCSAENCEQL